MVLLSVLILTLMSFPAFVRRCALVVFELFVVVVLLVFLVYCVVFLFVYLRSVSSAFNNVLLVHIFVVIYRKNDNIIKNNLCYGYVFIKCVSSRFNIYFPQLFVEGLMYVLFVFVWGLVSYLFVVVFVMIDLILIFGVVTPLSAIFQLYHGDQF